MRSVVVVSGLHGGAKAGDSGGRGGPGGGTGSEPGAGKEVSARVVVRRKLVRVGASGVIADVEGEEKGMIGDDGGKGGASNNCIGIQPGKQSYSPAFVGNTYLKHLLDSTHSR